jgi:hypothetical protein
MSLSATYTMATYGRLLSTGNKLYRSVLGEKSWTWWKVMNLVKSHEFGDHCNLQYLAKFYGRFRWVIRVCITSPVIPDGHNVLSRRNLSTIGYHARL